MSNTNELSMDELTLKEILTEQLEENKAVRKFMEELRQHIKEKDEFIEDMFATFEHEYSNLKVFAPEPDLSEVKATLDQRLAGIQQAIEKKPIPVIRQLRLLLFPETNTAYYYKLTLGRILPWLVAVLAITYLYSLGQDWLGRWQIVREKEIETNISARAWDRLYKKANTKDKKALDVLWQRSLNSN
jgi:hypothetical protein